MSRAENSSKSSRRETISLLDIMREPVDDRTERLVLITDRGNIETIYSAADAEGEPGAAGVVWVGGAGGGTEGPAGGIYHHLADDLVANGISSLRLNYRKPNNLTECVIDVLVGLAWLQDHGLERAALVGHSFGGAVVINAGALSPLVKAVAPLSSQTFGADLVGQVSPRALLLVHGRNDTVLPERCSLELYEQAGDPKKLVLYDNAGHGLDECRDELYTLLRGWLVKELASADQL